MSIYKKKVSSGVRFFKKGEDIKDGDIITIANEGEQEEGKWGTQEVFLVKKDDDTEGNVNFNQTTLNNLIDAYGNDSEKWIGKEVKVTVVKQSIQGKITSVYYFLHPDTVLDEASGIFVLPGGKTVKEDSIPVVDAKTSGNSGSGGGAIDGSGGDALDANEAAQMAREENE